MATETLELPAAVNGKQPALNGKCPKCGGLVTRLDDRDGAGQIIRGLRCLNCALEWIGTVRPAADKPAVGVAADAPAVSPPTIREFSKIAHPVKGGRGWEPAAREWVMEQAAAHPKMSQGDFALMLAAQSNLSWATIKSWTHGLFPYGRPNRNNPGGVAYAASVPGAASGAVAPGGTDSIVLAVIAAVGGGQVVGAELVLPSGVKLSIENLPRLT